MSAFTTAMKKVLKIVLKEKTYLEQNPKVLAKLMAEYNEIHYASRFHEDERKHDWDNLKYPVIELESQTTPEYAHLVYDAWCAGISREEYDAEAEAKKTKKFKAMEAKINKTMDDHVAICTSKEYRYNSLYPDRRQVLSHYLCTIGNGIDWNKDGFLTNMGPSGQDMMIYHNYREVEVPEKLLKQWTWLENEEIVKYRDKMNKVHKAAQAKRKKEEKAQDALMAKLKKMKDLAGIVKDFVIPADYPYYPMSEQYSNLCLIPDNAHESYKAAAIEVCEDILKNKKEEANNVKIATKMLKKLTKGK